MSRIVQESRAFVPSRRDAGAMLGKVLAVVAIVMGVLGASSGAFGPPYGVATVTRTLLGLTGAVGGVFLLTGRPQWPRILAVWSLLQIPVIIVDPSGPLFAQGCHLGMVQTQQSEVNGVVTSASGFGINLVGVLLLGLAFAARKTMARTPAGRETADAAALD